MSRRSASIKVNNHQPAWRKVVLNYGLVLFFGCVFVSGQLINLYNTPVGGSGIQDELIPLSPDASFLGSHPLHHPLASDPHKHEYLISGEEDSGDDLNSNWNKLCWDLPLEKKNGPDSEKNLLWPLVRAIENRPKLSLFILYHSWKIFLS